MTRTLFTESDPVVEFAGRVYQLAAELLIRRGVSRAEAEDAGLWVAVAAKMELLKKMGGTGDDNE